MEVKMSRINRISVYFFIALFIVTIYGLFTIKSKVIILKSELLEVQKQIKLEKDSVHVLKAEMAYLASPERLSKLNSNYLNLQGTTTKQLVQNPLTDKMRSYGIAKNTDGDRSDKRIIIREDKSSNSSSDIIKTGYNNNVASKYNKTKHGAVKWRYKKGPAKYTNK